MDLTLLRLYLGVILSPVEQKTSHRGAFCGTKHGCQPWLLALKSPPNMSRAIPRTDGPLTSASAARTNCIRGQWEDSQVFTVQPTTI